MHKSLATINSPEFINLKPLDINPLMSACEIKVLYVGENRNHSFISKEVATEMAKTLRGAPIVGYWRKDAEDFGDHGDRVIIDGEGIKFECLTKPYGFVAPDAKVWFQEFEDTNDFGETTVREYLMTTGYLWTEQFEECKSAVEGDGKPHSMELDPKTLKGHWSQNKSGMDFFIINDAIFSKLCILGEDVEPCFEGSSVKAPDVSASFTKVDDDFKHTLFSMMQDLKFALEGGQQMNENENLAGAPQVDENDKFEIKQPEFDTQEPVAPEAEAAPAAEDSFAASDNAPEETPAVDPEPEFKKDEDEDDKKDEDAGEDKKEDDKDDDDDEDKYAALEAQHSELQSAYSALEEKFATLESSYNELVEFKRQIDDAKKEEMINSFYMLSDDDKQDVIANKSKYSVEEIEEKLSVICFRKKVNFDLEDNSKNDNKTEQPVVTFNLSGAGSSKPAWLTAVENIQNNRK